MEACGHFWPSDCVAPCLRQAGYGARKYLRPGSQPCQAELSCGAPNGAGFVVGAKRLTKCEWRRADILG